MITRSFSPFPVLTTKRLVLRQLLESDVEEIFLLRSDAVINKYLNRQPCKTSANALSFITLINEHVAKNESLYWAITMADNPKLIGTICLFDISAEHNSGEIGYELLTDYQGQGIMNEAISSVITFAFQILGLTTMNAIFHKDNQASLKLLQKLNFENTNSCDESNPNLIVYRLSNAI